MAKRIDPEKLSQLLAPFGFTLNLPEACRGGVSFVRPSRVHRLYEHLLIRTGVPTFAEAVISGASFTSCHSCVSEGDKRLRALLSGNSEFGTTLLRTSADAKAWQQRLVENADAYCKLMARDTAPLLLQRLTPVFAAVDACQERLGDIFEIFDREFAFIAEASVAEQAEVDYLATNGRQWLYLNSEDVKLASLALARFGTDVKGRSSPFQNSLLRQDDFLAARLIMLADYVRKKRIEYTAVGGLFR